MPPKVPPSAPPEESFPRSAPERAALVKQWTPLARKIASHYLPRLSRWYELSDLVSMGQFVLWEATRTHDHPMGGAKFSTYAHISLVHRYQYLIQYWRQGTRRDSRRAVSLDEVNEDGSPVWQLEGTERAPDDALAHRADAAELRRAMSRLSVRERLVIRRRFMAGELLSDIAEDFQVSRERVRQIEQAALGKLRQALNGARPELRGRPGPVSCRGATARASPSRRKVAASPGVT